MPTNKIVPVDIVKAINAYCAGTGRLENVADALDVDLSSFTGTWRFYEGLLYPFDPKPVVDAQLMLNIISLHFIGHYRREVIRLKATIDKLQRKAHSHTSRIEGK